MRTFNSEREYTYTYLTLYNGEDVAMKQKYILKTWCMDYLWKKGKEKGATVCCVACP